MALPTGTHIGVYEVVAKVGEGGMGEVYRAHDTKLARDVALKVIPDAFAHDAERLARFEREARTLASLNHAHIAQVYGFEQSGGVNVLVMEFVDRSEERRVGKEGGSGREREQERDKYDMQEAQDSGD